MKKIVSSLLLCVLCSADILQARPPQEEMIIPGGLTLELLETMLREAEGLPFTACEYLPNYLNTHVNPSKYTGSKKYSGEYKWKTWKERKLIDYKLQATVDRGDKYWYQSRLLAKGYDYVFHGPDYPTALYPGSPSNPQVDMKRTIYEAPFPEKFYGQFAHNELIRLGRVDLRNIVSVTEEKSQGFVTYKVTWRTFWTEKTPFLIEGTDSYDIGETRGLERQSVLAMDDAGAWHVYKLWDERARKSK